MPNGQETITPQATETNLLVSANFARANEIYFTSMFGESVRKLTEALGVTRKISKQAGTTLKTYKVTGTLQDGTVAEGATIPLSKYETTETPLKEITLKKWRKATTAEAILEKGFEQAVTDTTTKMLRQIQAGIRTSFFSFLATGTSTATGVGLQAAFANAWGKMQVLFEDDAVETVYFVNPTDVANYLGGTPISVQNAFGMNYLENFLGLGTVIMNASVPAGTFYATAKNNLVLYYIPAGGTDLNRAFTFTTDETGYIGVHNEPAYDNMTNSTTAISGVELLADQLTGIVVGTIAAK